jgi:hypothetical protein
MLKVHGTLLPLPHTLSRHRAKKRVQAYINIIKFYNLTSLTILGAINCLQIKSSVA